MQINELLLKNFGKFHDRQINLEEGINLIHGENESGKSTIHTFIKGMLFGIERGRGRAAQNDTFSIYEPWDNPNYYSGTLKFASGGKHFRIERNFDKYSKKAELVCIEDGEVLSVEDGDLQMLLGEMDADRYYRPAYFGDGWVGIRLDLGDTDWDAIGEWLRKSWLAIAPKKLAGLMGAADEF